MEYDEPDYTMKDINEWIRIITYTLFVWIIGYVFRGYYISENMDAGLWVYIFWVVFITIYSMFKGRKKLVKKA